MVHENFHSGQNYIGVFIVSSLGAFHLVCTYIGGGGVGGGGGSCLLYISIAYYMQKGGKGVQRACQIAYILNGRPLCHYFCICISSKFKERSQWV